MKRSALRLFAACVLLACFAFTSTGCAMNQGYAPGPSGPMIGGGGG